MLDLDYVHKKLTKCRYIYIGDTASRGIGIFAAREFALGSSIVIDEFGDYYDGAITEAEALVQGLNLSIHCFQIDHDRYLLPHGSIDDLINHSCEPSAGIRLTAAGYRLLALRDIGVGEEVTYDYSTYITNPRERLSCACGSAHCRGNIGPFRDLPRSLQAHYLALGVVGAFVAADAAAHDAAA